MSVLETLATQDFEDRFAWITSPDGLVSLLQNAPEVIAVGAALRAGAVSDEHLRGMVDQMLRDFHRGTRFPHQVGLSALAVSLTDDGSRFAEELLRGLAKSAVAELGLASRVARCCLRLRRVRVPATYDREFQISVPLPPKRITLVPEPPPLLEDGPYLLTV
jgi:hypothetical protein